MNNARIKTIAATAALTLLASLLVAACARSNAAPASTPGVAAETRPSYEVLFKDGFVDAEIPRITAEELKRRLDKGEDIILIDTRRDWKFEMGHLRGAINIMHAVDSPYPGEEDAMNGELEALPDDALKVLYCN